MVELETGWKPSTKLNVIAGELDFAAVDPLPEGVTRDQIEEECYTIRQLYGDYIDELVAETTLSLREAQTWALRNLVHEGSERLSYEAIGLYIWAIGRATEGDPLSRTIVSDYYRRAEEKISRAEETVKRTGPPPYPDDLYEEPALVWVEADVGERLRRRVGPEETYSDLVDRLLDETTPSVSLSTLVEAYRDERGSEYVAVETVRPGWDAELRLVVHAPDPGDAPASVADAEVVTVDGRPYEFAVSERADVRREASHVPVFAAGSEGEAGGGGEAVAVADGIERLRRALESVEMPLQTVVERARDAGAVALAVDHEPAAAGVHLYPVFPDGATPTDPFGFLERVPLDDRTLTVGSVSPVTVDEYGSLAAGATVLWADEGGPEGPRPLPDDPAERRERFPATVLRTAT